MPRFARPNPELASLAQPFFALSGKVALFCHLQVPVASWRCAPLRIPPGGTFIHLVWIDQISQQGPSKSKPLILVTRGGLLCQNQPIGGTLRPIYLNKVSRGWSWANLPKSATRGRSKANLPKSAARSAHRLICPNQPPGGALRPICPNQPPGGTPEPICQNQPPGGSPGTMPKPATRGRSRANMPKSATRGLSLNNLPKSATRGAPSQYAQISR